MTDDDLRRLLPLPPRRRPGPLAVAVRWRAELLAVGVTAAAWYAFGGTAVVTVAVVLAGLVVAVPPVRRHTRGLLQAVIVMHRVRSGLVQGGVADRSGRLPWVVAACPVGDDAVRVTLWLRSGTTLRDVERSLPVVTVACAAAHAELLRHAPRQDRMMVLVTRPRWGWWTR
jgi:hypothetical protein